MGRAWGSVRVGVKLGVSYFFTADVMCTILDIDWKNIGQRKAVGYSAHCLIWFDTALCKRTTLRVEWAIALVLKRRGTGYPFYQPRA